MIQGPLILLLIALVVGDLYTTNKVLTHGRELNPMDRYIMSKGKSAWYLFRFVVTAGAIAAALHSSYATIALGSLDEFYDTVVGWNIYQEYPNI